MSDQTREETDAKISAAEARTDTKIARLEGKLDLVVSKIDGMNQTLSAKVEGATQTSQAKFDAVNQMLAEVSDNTRSTRSNVWVVGLGLAAVITALALGLPTIYDFGTRLRDIVQHEVLMQRNAPPADLNRR